MKNIIRKDYIINKTNIKVKNQDKKGIRPM